MGFLRKTIILGTGGLAPIKSRSYAERSAKALEKQARLQEQLLKQQQTMPAGRAARAAAPATPPKRANTPLKVRPARLQNRHRVLFDHLASALASCGLTEHSRYGHSTVEGVWAEAQMWFKDDELSLQVGLFADSAVACQAEQALSREPKFAAGISEGSKALRVVDRMLCRWQAVGDQSVNATRMDDIARVVEQVAAAPLDETSRAVEQAGPTSRKAPLPVVYSETTPAEPRPGPSDPLEQLRKLGELRDAGVVSDEEFAAKKTELLGRI